MKNLLIGLFVRSVHEPENLQTCVISTLSVCVAISVTSA